MSKLYESITEANWSESGGFAKFNAHSAAFGAFPYDQACLFNHLALKCNMMDMGAARWDVSKDASSQLVALERAIMVLFPERVIGHAAGRNNSYLVAAFNDCPETTLEDVLRVCKLADV